jgi:hypothetical protein
VETLAVYHLGNLLGAHTSVLACEAVEYCFFDFHIPKLQNFSEIVKK